MLKKISICLLALVFVLAACFGCSPEEPVQTASVMDVQIKTLPKTEYVLGETFETEGGMLELFYTDDTTDTIPFTEEGVTVTPPDMTTVGTKTVTVDYDGFKNTYQITVAQKTYTVTFELNYPDAPAAEKVTVTENAAIGTPAEPKREGYRFDGWYTQAEGGEAFEFSGSSATGNLTLYAHWTQVFTVLFDFNYENAPQGKAVQVDAGTAISSSAAPSAIRDGYRFVAWYAQAEGGEAYSFDTPVTQDLTLYAHWEELSAEVEAFDVTFNYCYAGMENRVERVVEGEKVARPADPVLSGRSLEGWYTDAAYTSAYDFDSPVTQELTLYAKWEISAYTLTYVYSIGGTQTTYATRQVPPGLPAPKVAMPEVEGYYFVEDAWYTDAACTQLFVPNTMVSDDCTLYGKPLKENLFEAEYTYIDQTKNGQGFSNNMNGVEIIDRDNGTANASNGYWVSNLFYNGAFLEFVITADETVDDAVLMLRLSPDYYDMGFAPESTTIGGQQYDGFVISSAPALTDGSGAPQKDELGYVLYDESAVREYDYDPILLTGAVSFEDSMTDKRPFEDYLITAQLHLDKGVNVIRLTVNNTHNYEGTMHAGAPMIDCLYIYTDIGLTWDPCIHNTDNIMD